MNGRLPLLEAKELIKILNKMGFNVIRQKGSHVYLKHSDGRCTVVPSHANREIGRGLLKRILNEIDVSREEFINFTEGKK
ncbi:type II toxin-antitoxin system HicA family toxin [Candidatus Woesearchaeota archaeon]|nr:type II toxin-antitoxin system HicA family toxin [Candidatus Woesearchaeota archaeon]